MRRYLAATIALCSFLALTMLIGCSLAGGGDDSKKASRRPRDSDVLTLRNGDTWHGTVFLETIRLKTPYAGEIVLPRKEIDRVEILGTGQMRIRTKEGDRLNTEAPGKELRFKTKIGEELVVKVKQIREILFK